MRLLGIAGVTGLLSMALTAPAQAGGLPELWYSGQFTAQYTIAAGDVNGDGTDDLVGISAGATGHRVALSDGTAFGPQRYWGRDYYADSRPWVRAHLVGDMDGDARADVVVVRLPSPRGIWVSRSTGTQFVVPPVRWLDNSVVGDHSTHLADVDADGDADVVALYGGGVPALVARSAGTASLPLTTWGPSVLGTVTSLVADTTGDASADLVLVDTTGVRVIPAAPNWHTTPQQQWTTTPFWGTRKTLPADIDADGDADLVAINDTDVRVMRSTGTSFAAPEVWHPAPFAGTRETLAADVDGDGDADLVAVNADDIWVLRTQ